MVLGRFLPAVAVCTDVRAQDDEADDVCQQHDDVDEQLPDEAAERRVGGADGHANAPLATRKRQRRRASQCFSVTAETPSSAIRGPSVQSEFVKTCCQKPDANYAETGQRRDDDFEKEAVEFGETNSVERRALNAALYQNNQNQNERNENGTTEVDGVHKVDTTRHSQGQAVSARLASTRRAAWAVQGSDELVPRMREGDEEKPGHVDAKMRERFGDDAPCAATGLVQSTSSCRQAGQEKQ